MAGYSHLYVTAHGHFNSPAWAGESAQIGVRVGIAPLGVSDASPIIPLRDNGPVTATFKEDVTASWVITRTFRPNFPGLGTEEEDWDVMDDLAADMWQFLVATTGLSSKFYTWDSVRIAPIEYGTGKYLAPATTYTRRTPLTGALTKSMPPDSSICVSWRAPIVGKRGRGRVYLPGFSPAILTDEGKLKAEQALLGAQAGAALISALGNLPGLDAQWTGLIICSAASKTAVVPTQVRVGDHIDTQRRRELQNRESYTEVPL